MNEKSANALEFNKIINILCEYAVSDYAKNKLLNLKPSLNEQEVKAKIMDTTEARKILDQVGSPPLATMKDIDMLISMAQKGSMLIPEQLTQIGLFITACMRMKQYLKRAESLQVAIAGYGGSIDDLSKLSSEINVAIRNNMVDTYATNELRDIRKKLDQLNNDIKSKLDHMLRSKKDWFTDSYVSMRNGHYVLPVKKEYKNQVSGTVLDISSTGSTYFMEPHTVSKIKDEISLWEIAESNEERRILYSLTNLVVENETTLKLNMECMETLDFIFAKAKLSLDMKAVPADINTNRHISIKNGRHPLLKQQECVPLNFELGKDISGVIITGPNTGGKTVALKTIGLLHLMAQSGLHVPCDSADLCMNTSVLCDIGDGQSITENLSTFSSHITNIIHILSETNRDSLILLDELGSGTDPAEGMGIAIAILEELRQKQCIFVATTHYPEVKDYANNAHGLQNARMAFDRETLKPLYRLEIGEAGESCALYIAKRLGFSKRMLERAYDEAYGKDKRYDKHTPEYGFITEIEEQPPLTPTNTTAIPRIEKSEPKKQSNTRSQRFQIGDSVMVYPQKKIGIVFATANEYGEVGVQIQKKKEYINHKRLQLKASASELYPADYDFSIVFDSVVNRKARHTMSRKHQSGVEIVYDKGDLNSL